jgi:GNAT superfamily N-acetyltransferase
LTGAPAEPPFRSEPLSDRHDRTRFACGVDALDRYFRGQAGQDMRRRVANCFVLVSADTGAVAGYYTLSAASLALTELPAEVARKLPRYPAVPVTLMGRLAVDLGFRGRRLGELLVADAVARCLRADMASYALVVDAKDERVGGFYRRLGFRNLPDAERRLFLPLSEAATLFG